MTVRINPKGSVEHNFHTLAKINNCTRADLESVLGAAHTEGDGYRMSAEWFLVTDAGNAVVNDYWAFNEGEYAIRAALPEAAAQVVDYLVEHNIQAYRLTGAM